MTGEYRKPLPRVTSDNRPFWEATKRHELRLQRCGACGRFRYPPAPVCPDCLSEDAEWTPVSGRGTVTTFIVMHKVYFQSFAGDVPYNVVQVELEEGPRLTANLVDVPNEGMTVGMPVEVVFDDVTPEITLPRFRRTS
ncbi:MAG: OB-fold domain-containing protein [Candidatus Rokubacteria bacterium]|nr:OB-fold domain-containing protein [Candidatus Rokubacteria bacterium]